MAPSNAEGPPSDPVPPAQGGDGTPTLALLRFGEFTLDPQRRALLRGDERLHLTEKPLSTLLLLVRQHGRVVSKRSIMDDVWKDTIVTEDNLVQAVSEIRRTLGDDKDNPRYVQTVPRDGYRFIAHVESIVAPPPARHTGESGAVAATPVGEGAAVARTIRLDRTRRSWPVALVAAVAVVAVAAAWFLMRARAEARSSPLVVARQRLFSDFPGSHSSGSLSPDGAMIAYVDASTDRRQLWVRSVSGGNPVKISPGQVSAERPRWSPAGDVIAFNGSTALDANATTDIWVVTPLGGTARPLIRNARNVNWSADGTRLVFERGTELWIADRDGSGQRRVEGVAPAPIQLAPRMPALSPDGSAIVFFEATSGPAGDYWIVPSRGGPARRLTRDEAEGGPAVWTPDGKSIVFPSRRGGSLTLWRISALGGTAEPVLVGAGDDSEPDVSSDGRTLLFTNTRRDFVITVVASASGTERPLRENRKGLLAPAFSPQGERIVFSETDADESAHIAVMDTGGQDVRPLTFGADHHDIFPQWSSDGRSIYFYRESSKSFVRIGVDGRDSGIVVGAGWTWERQHAARVDPSGERIVYLVLSASGSKASSPRSPRTIIRELGTGRERTLPVSLDHPRWSPDGKWLAGATPLGGDTPLTAVTVCHVGRGDCRTIARGFDVLWSRDGRRIYFLRSGASPELADVWSTSVAGEDERHHGTIGPLRSIALFYDIAPDGRIVYVQYRTGRSELWLADLVDGSKRR